MSDYLGMCLQIIGNGVSIGTSTWGISVYLISRGRMVLTGSISKSGCFSDMSELVLIVGDLVVIRNIFLSLIWIYGPIC